MNDERIGEKGLLMQFTDINGTTTTLANRDNEMRLEEMLTHMRAFAVACGYLESAVNEVFGDI